MAHYERPPGPDFEPNDKIRLDRAARIKFPDGSIGPQGLRRERDRGRLQTWIIAGKEYTTLAAIEQMLELCRVPPKPPVRRPEELDKPDPERVALAAAWERLQASKPSSERIPFAQAVLMAKLAASRTKSPGKGK